MRMGITKVVAVGVLVIGWLVTPGTGFAQSTCDAGITKAAGKKAACKAKVHAKGQKTGTPPDSAKLAQCDVKFEAACAKAQAAGDCVEQMVTCTALEAEVDACVDDIVSNPAAACPTTGGAATVCNSGYTVNPCSTCCAADNGCLSACQTAGAFSCGNVAANDACNVAANAAGCADECCP